MFVVGSHCKIFFPLEIIAYRAIFPPGRKDTSLYWGFPEPVSVQTFSIIVRKETILPEATLETSPSDPGKAKTCKITLTVSYT